MIQRIKYINNNKYLQETTEIIVVYKITQNINKNRIANRQQLNNNNLYKKVIINLYINLKKIWKKIVVAITTITIPRITLMRVLIRKVVIIITTINLEDKNLSSFNKITININSSPSSNNKLIKYKTI